MVKEKIYIVIFIIAWIIPNLLSEHIQCKVKNCKECLITSNLTCIRCSNNYILKNNNCNQIKKESKSKSLEKLEKSTQNYFNDNNNIPVKDNNRILTSEPKPPRICDVDNCLICYNKLACKQCINIDYFVDQNGKCRHFCDQINCKVCDISKTDGSWQCTECLMGFTMISKISIFIFNYYSWLLC